MLEDILTIVISTTAVITAILAMGWFVFGYADTIHNWMHRRDLNRNVRKDTHIAYIKTMDALTDDIEKNKKITNNDELIKILGLINSAAGTIKNRSTKKLIVSKKIIIDQLKFANTKGIDKNFKINENKTIEDLISVFNLDLKINNSKDANNAILLVATAALTEQAPIIRYDKKYNELVDVLFNIKKQPKMKVRKIINIIK